MDPWFSLVLLTCSQLILCWYCYQLAGEKGYSKKLFAIAAILPVFSLTTLMLLLLLPDRRLEQRRVYFSQHRQRP